jgi:hypothetical protein
VPTAVFFNCKSTKSQFAGKEHMENKNVQLKPRKTTSIVGINLGHPDKMTHHMEKASMDLLH